MAASVGKTFEFVSIWHFDAAVQDVWDTLVDPATWPEWWDGLEASSVDRHPLGSVGSTSELLWRSPLGYKLKLILTLTEAIEPRHTSFTSDGDLVGSGRCDLSGNETTTVSIIWQVAPTKPWMKALGTLLTPVFKANHTSLMKAGERGLRQHLEKS
ncbi:MAG: SRPBCC family protein [Candidatus Saccharibacteria bacterium]